MRYYNRVNRTRVVLRLRKGNKLLLGLTPIPAKNQEILRLKAEAKRTIGATTDMQSNPLQPAHLQSKATHKRSSSEIHHTSLSTLPQINRYQHFQELQDIPQNRTKKSRISDALETKAETEPTPAKTSFSLS